MRKQLLSRLPVLLSVCACALFGQRTPVLNQIDLPHPYYYREMYLPQFTTGPSSLTWSPDSKRLVYSMAGSLWMQEPGSELATQLTTGAGYDYQPDWSPDGRWIVYACHDHNAIELKALDLQTRRVYELTANGQVNVEPRWSPDGARIAFVSTIYNRRFHIFIADFHTGTLSGMRRATGESTSSVPRYYYSQFDHEISPVWSPDGQELIFVSNRNRIYGSGGLWRMPAFDNGPAREIHYEETTWKTRPDWAPDGSNIIYSSYVGRQWHQLWILPAKGGDPLPLSFGEFDNVAPRWSPDGRQIGIISNRGGNTSAFVLQFPGGAERPIVVIHREYMAPRAVLSIAVLDSGGRETPARLSVSDSDGRAYAPDSAWVHADDSLDVATHREARYFYIDHQTRVSVPTGNFTVTVSKGLDYIPETQIIRLDGRADRMVVFRLKRVAFRPDERSRWVSGDLHVHMNYGGAYRNTPAHMVLQGDAEGLGLIQNLIVNKEQRIPDVAYFQGSPDPASSRHVLLLHGQEVHTNQWGHLSLLNLENLVIPYFAGYLNTAMASLVPMNADILKMAHQQSALGGYVHPFDAEPDPRHDADLTNELPVDVALGVVDYMEILGFSDHKSTAEVWHRLLNCGFHLPAAAGTDAMANFASLRGPVGLNRVYCLTDRREINAKEWFASLKRGQSFATNGPLLRFALGGRLPGDTIETAQPRDKIHYAASLRSIAPVDHLQVVCNGTIAQEIPVTKGGSTADAQGSIQMDRSGWCLLRAWSDHPQSAVFDQYPYATTSPVYVKVGDSAVKSKDDGAYFVAWIDRLVDAARRNTTWRTPAEKAHALETLSKARTVYERQAQ
jgi:hypothetical protein